MKSRISAGTHVSADALRIQAHGKPEFTATLSANGYISAYIGRASVQITGTLASGELPVSVFPSPGVNLRNQFENPK